MVKSKYSKKSSYLIATRHRKLPLVPTRAPWAIMALITSVWTQIQCFSKKRSCIQTFTLPTVNSCPWIHSSCQLGINIPLSLSHHQTNTQWNKKLGWYLSWWAHIRQPQWEEILHHSPVTEPSANSSGSLLLAQENMLILVYERQAISGPSFLPPAPKGYENDDTDGPPPQSESDAEIFLVRWASLGMFFSVRIGKVTVLFFKGGFLWCSRLFHPSWSLDQVIGEVRGRATSERPGVANNRAGSTPA